MSSTLATSSRSMTRREKAILSGLMGGGPLFIRAGMLIIYAIAWLGLFAVCLVVLKELVPFIADRENQAMLVLVVVAVILAVLIERKRAVRYATKAEVAELRDGKVLVHRCQSDRTLLVDEFEDNGTGAYVDVGDDRCMFLMDQELTELVRVRKFPSSVVEVVETPVSNHVVGIRCLGEYVRPVGTLPAFDKIQFSRGQVPDNGSVVDARFDDLAKQARNSA